MVAIPWSIDNARTKHYLDHPDEDLPDGGDSEQAEQFVEIYKTGASTRREPEGPARFAVDDRVRVRNINPSGHTRCARYLRGKEGVITEVYDPFVFPDSNAHEQGENPQRVYNVRFEAEDVWGPAEGGERHAIHFDLWEPYLEAA
jgi:nitrile hydratase subunit beta